MQPNSPHAGDGISSEIILLSFTKSSDSDVPIEHQDLNPSLPVALSLCMKLSLCSCNVFCVHSCCVVVAVHICLSVYACADFTSFLSMDKSFRESLHVLGRHLR